MNHFYVWNIKRYKQLIIIGGLALFVGLFLFIEEKALYQMFSNTQQVALTKANNDENRVALTFNISWGDEKVIDILEVLRKNNVQATFFVSGEWAERHPQILEKIQEEKHELGMLGYRYKSYLEQEIDQVKKDIIYAQEIFSKLGYKNIRYTRPPSGHLNEEIIQTIEDMDYQVIHWSINPNDWENPGVKQIEEHVLTNTTSGDIILLHASDAAKQTAEALDIILPTFKKDDFDLVTISSLIEGVSMEEKIVE